MFPRQLEETLRPIDNPFGLAGVAGAVAGAVGAAGLVEQTMQPAQASLWLRLPATPQLAR